MSTESDAWLQQYSGVSAADMEDGKKRSKKHRAPPPDYQGAIDQMNANPVDWASAPKVDSGMGAADIAYNQATSRLDPQWDRREDAMHTRLINQGFDPGAEGYKNQMTDLGMQRNDAYGAARADAIGQGRGVFQDSSMARQQAIAEMLRKRMQPLQELGLQQGLWSGDLDARDKASFDPGDVLDAALEFGQFFNPFGGKK